MAEIVAQILFLIFLEGILSFDNALVFAATVRHLPAHQRKKALTYGIWGAFGFRILALACLTFLLTSPWIKLVGGAYLIYIGLTNLFGGNDEAEGQIKVMSFWRTVLAVELADMVFSVDSIVAAVGVSDVLWIIVTGGIIGIVMMRFASAIFVTLMDRFSRLETTAFILVLLIGIKLILEIAIHEHAELIAGVCKVLSFLALGYGFSKREAVNG